jgi:hypothetical protein
MDRGSDATVTDTVCRIYFLCYSKVVIVSSLVRVSRCELISNLFMQVTYCRSKHIVLYNNVICVCCVWTDIASVFMLLTV